MRPALTAWLAGLTLAIARPAHALQRPPDRPNIVVYVADDLGWRDIGMYGNAAVRTPNIDRLARSGLLVRYAFVTSPQCSPSRISILSGRYPHTTRTEDLHTPTPAGVRILPSYLQSAGYFTGMMAKTHLGPTPSGSSSGTRRRRRPRCRHFSTRRGLGRFSSGSAFHEPHRPYERRPRRSARAGAERGDAVPGGHARDPDRHRPLLRRHRDDGRQDRRR